MIRDQGVEPVSLVTAFRAVERLESLAASVGFDVNSDQAPTPVVLHSEMHQLYAGVTPDVLV